MPWTTLGFWAAVWIPGLALTPPEPLWAALFSAAFAVLAWLRPRQALFVLFLGTAWFLGAPRRPYLWLLPTWQWVWLLAANLRLARQGRGAGLAAAGWLWLIPAVAMAALPLSQAEYAARFWATPWSVLAEQFMSPDSGFLAYHWRLVLDLAAGVLTCGTIWRLWSADEARRDLIGAGLGLAGLVLLMSLAGLLLCWLPGLRGDRYLSLPLSGVEYGGLGMTGLTYNRQYLLMFILAAGPLVDLAARAGRPRQTALALAWLALAGGLAVVAYAGQRLPALVLLALCGGALFLLRWPKLKWALAGLTLLLAALLAADGLREWPILGKLASTGLGDAYLRIWRVAGTIFAAHPLLGVGVGQYAWHADWAAALNPASALVITEVRGTPHNWWLMLAAEQGLAGLLVWLGCLWPLVVRSLAQARASQSRPLVALVLTLLVLIALSLVQSLLYFPAFALWFWVVLGFCGVLAPPRSQPDWPAGRLRRQSVLVALLALAVLAGWQGHQGRGQPPGSFAAGLYGKERFAGVEGRWMAPRAALTVEPGEGDWRVRLNSFLPNLDQAPQTLEVEVEGRPLTRLTWREPRWQELVIPREGQTRRVIVRFRASRTFNPRQSGINGDGRDLAAVIQFSQQSPTSATEP